MKRFCSVVTNEVTNDYRIQKECNSLKGIFDTTILGFHRRGTKRGERKDGIRIIRTGEPLLRRLVLLVAPNAHETLTVDDKKAGSARTFINDMTLFLLFINKNFSILKRLLFIKADIYQANDLDTLLPVVLVGKLRGAKIVYDSHELCVEEGFIKTRLFKYLLSLIERTGIKNCSLVLTVSKSIAYELKKRYQLESEPLVIRNTPEYLKIRYAWHGKRLVKEGNRDTNDYHKIIFLGVLAPMRGIEQSMLAMKLVKNAKLFIRGYGPSERYFREFARKTGVEDRVVFLAPQKPSELVRSCSKFDIGILPYRNTCLNYYYAAPNKIYVYMMAGLAVLGSDFPEIHSIIKKNRIGELFNPDDPKDIAMQINRIINGGKINQYRRNSLRASRKYSWNVDSRLYYASIKQTLG